MLYDSDDEEVKVDTMEDLVLAKRTRSSSMKLKAKEQAQ
jgi:hypothetical protein